MLFIPTGSIDLSQIDIHRVVYLLDEFSALFGDYKFAGTYGAHPDPRQEAFFFGLVKEGLEEGVFTEAQLRDEIAQGHLRTDAMALIGL